VRIYINSNFILDKYLHFDNNNNSCIPLALSPNNLSRYYYETSVETISQDRLTEPNKTNDKNNDDDHIFLEDAFL
jgi:hypothetical protein